MQTIFKTIAGSRLYGTNNANSDTDYKAVHLPTKSQILLGRTRPVISESTGSKTDRNTEKDVDTESFSLQRFLELASDMQTIPVEMLFASNTLVTEYGNLKNVWNEVVKNRNKILNNNTKAFVGYCKGQAVRYSLRGKRLETFIAVKDVLTSHTKLGVLVSAVKSELSDIEGVKFVSRKQPGNVYIDFMDVFGRQVPVTIKCAEAAKIYQKPIDESGSRAVAAMNNNSMDCKSLYHAMRIVDEGIQLFKEGTVTFPCQNIDLLMKIRNAELSIDEVLDLFDEKMDTLINIGDNSPLSARPDKNWIDSFVHDVYNKIVCGKL